MLIVGLTGGIASGKSLVARVFKGLGAHLIDADKIVHELLEPGQDAWEEIRAHFGDAVLLPDRCIDRRKLGDIVFHDPAERAWLNRCLHPRVFESFTAMLRRLAQGSPEAVVVLDAALLIETGYHKKMDRLIVVYADPEQQVVRLMERDRFTRDQALARMQSQIPLAEKRRYADYVIDNTGSRDRTEQEARDVYARLKEEAKAQP